MLDNYYIQRKTSRRKSRSARYAPACAFIGMCLLVAAVALHRFSLIQQPDLVFLVALSAFMAVLTLLLCVKSFYNLWRSGDTGGRRALHASFIATLTLVPPALVFLQVSATPRIHDISTDLENSVQFNSVMSNEPDLFQPHEPNFRIRALSYLGLDDLFAENNLSTDAVPDILQQISAYPEVSGRQYASAQDHVLKAVLKVMKEQGFTVTGSTGVAGEDIDVSVEGVARTFILGLRSDVAVRLRDEAEQTIVDMRAVSHYGRYDFGFNAALIEDFFTALDLEMRNAVPDAPQE